MKAITNLEQSLAQDKPRALIQMATGSGKTYTAVNFIYRLISQAGAKLVLFLVDRNNLGKQANNEFVQFVNKGGRWGAMDALGAEWQQLLDEMNRELIL